MLTVEDMRVHLRVTGDSMDTEIKFLMDGALADMERVGIDVYAAEYAENLMNIAVVSYCKANFGFDNPDAPLYEMRYRQTVCDLLNSKASLDRSE